jgi:hypothetical protein
MTSLDIIENITYLEIESSIGTETNNIEITSSSLGSVDIVSGYSSMIVYASDVVGLNNYLSNFIDHYEIDCGSP